MPDRPRLRPIEFQPITYQGQQMWLLNDPLELSDHQLVLPAALAQMLVFCDGTRYPLEIKAALSQQLGVPVNAEIVHDTLSQLDQACLLENDRSKQVIQVRLRAYRNQPYRQPALAGLSYPADPDELSRELAAYSQEDNLDGWQPWFGRGIVSPHIDYNRGGHVYAKVWRRAAAAVKAADLVLIFGTDHYGSPGSVTLTSKPYSTPYGVIPTDSRLVESLAEAIGPDAFAEELHHRKEHSVELSAVWLHHTRGSDICPMVPILCGSFEDFVTNEHQPADDAKLTRFIDALCAETEGKTVLAVASVDLAHVGPVFGDEFPMNVPRRMALKMSDQSLMDAIGHGDAARFYGEIAAVSDRNRICGFSSIYLLLRYLGQTQGIQVSYALCPADPQEASLVSICGLLLE